ncbi:microtubule-associated protein futsch [Kryptolebias marmoratus]|uniref:microtubule-associated protein futsch n=1 Tax=Kryptolebias marmoratus TaxID=37003 RepID=UPI0007F93E7A|nr:microtubule-associated protein futsch [Kryptolebias marmoratus]
MMEFWSENQRQSHVYSRFGTVPGRHCAHNYHDRHQISHYPLNFGEEQHQGRQSGDWPLPGTRAPLHEYTNWTDPTSSSFHFPVIVDTQDQGGYRQQDAGHREWTMSQRAAGDYERGFLREGWQQRRWEPGNPLSYSREISAKRNGSNYRELKAWAARYSHSLPRRRRVEEELRGTSQQLVDPQMQLQHVQKNPDSRTSGLWDRGRRLQAPAHDTNIIKENTGYQRRAFSQPPGYVAPPPYKNPLKSSPMKPFCDTSKEQLGRKQAYWSRKQDVSADLEDRKMEKEEFRKSDESNTCQELEGPKHTSQEGDTCPFIQNEDMLALQHPQAAQNSQITSKVIEGRKFRLNKKTGGMTIFCLVSRIVSASETPSLPVRTSQTNLHSTEQGEVSTDQKNRHEISQLGDEVDFEASTSTEQLSPSDVRCLKATQTGKETLKDDLTNKAEANIASLESVTAINDTTSGQQVSPSVQPVSVKYPLWREPSSTTSPPQTHLDEESDPVLNLHKAGNVSNHPMAIERKKTDTEDREGLMVIDTSCVVVKVELIPSPKKEHSVSSANTDLNYHTNQDRPIDQNKDATHLQINTSHETEASSSREQPSPVSGTETLGERAERILGLLLHDSITEERPDGASVFDSRVEEQTEKAEPSLSEQTLEDTVEEGQAVQTEGPEHSKDSEDIRNQGPNEASKGFTESQEKFAHVSEDGNPDNKTSAETETTEDTHLETTSEKGQSQDKTLPDIESTQPPDLWIAASPAPCEPLLILPTSEESLESKVVSRTPDANLAPRPNASPLSPAHLFSSHPAESADSSLNSAPHTDDLSAPPPLEETSPTADEAPGAEHEDEEDEPSHLTESWVKGESPASGVKEEEVLQQQAECHQPDSAASEEQQTEEADEEPENGLKETLQTSEANGRIDPNILSECGQTEGAACVKESHRIEEQPPQETKEDPLDAKVQTPETGEESQENASTGQIDVNIFQQLDCCQEEDAFCKQETGETQKDLSQEGAADTQTQINTNILQPESSDSSCFLASDSPPGAPPEPDTNFSSLETDSVCPSPPSLVSAAAEADSSPCNLDICEEPNQFSHSHSHSHSHSPPSAARKRQKAQYPKILRDVVNRIRKHTAPDSESEEEEVSELWDPESVGEKNSGCPDVVAEVESERIGLEAAEGREVLKESAETGHRKQDDEEALSCSSSSRSFISEDTVIGAEEETRLATKMEKKNETSVTTEGTTCCSSGHETPSEEEEEEEEMEPNNSGQSEEEVEMMEPDSF